jgi:8-oxo-dGTP pyrophosphatase MutT (NUDIX family)
MRYLYNLKKSVEFADPAREVSCIAVVHNGQILMGKRNDNQKWTNPGGHLEASETPIEAALRELYEETGIEADYHDLRHLESEVVNTEHNEPIRVHAYTYLPGSKPEVVHEGDPDGEIGRWKWIPMNRIPTDENLHVPRQKNVIFQGLGGNF